MQSLESISANDRKIITMQENHDLFIETLMLLLDILENKTNYANATKLLQELNETKIDIDRKGSIIKKVFMLVDIYFDLLKSQDKKLFNLYTKQNKKVVKVTVIPGVDIGAMWDKLEVDDQNRIWEYLKYMYISSSHMVNVSGNENDVVNIDKVNELRLTLTGNEKEIYNEFWQKFPKNTLVTKVAEFNPFIGVGENKAEYGVNDLLSGPTLLPDQSAPGIDGITKLLGIDKILNLEDLSKQLKNITKEQIDQATKSIKSLLGDVDENTSEMIDLMLNDITDELKKEDISNGHPIDNLVKIAECVAHKMMPKIDPKKVDMNKVWNSTRNIASKCHDKDGKPIFDGPNNPLSIVTNLMERQMNQMQQKSMNPRVNLGESSEPQKPMTEDDYAKECQNILKQLGLPNMSVNQLKNLKLDKLIDDLNTSDLINKSIGSNDDTDSIQIEVKSKSKLSQSSKKSKRK